MDMLATSPQPGTQPDAASLTDEDALFAWVAEVCGGPVQRAVQASGGNRCRSWAIDVAAPVEAGWTPGRMAEAFETFTAASTATRSATCRR